MQLNELVKRFIDRHKLPASFNATACNFYSNIANRLVERSQLQTQPLLVGIHGCQGSGKSTLADFLVFIFRHHFGVTAANVSIDDFYLTRDQRQQLAKTVHPLFSTRGVPGTHDIPLMNETLHQLKAGESLVCIPRFNKAIDDRAPQSDWSVLDKPAQIILFEGWCVGARAEADEALWLPVNELEEKEDSNRQWRTYVNDQLKGPYAEVFNRIDALVMLQAPGFFAVQDWRYEQEIRLAQKLANTGANRSALMGRTDIERFVQHYQRVTEHALASLPAKADELLVMDAHRKILSASTAGERA